MRVLIEAALTGPIAAVLLLLPSPGHACSKIGFPGVRSEREAHFIASASSDTVFSGTGGVVYRVARGHFGPAGVRPIFGQIVSVERIGGLASALLPRLVSHVVLVPWDYASDCQPTPWTRSAVWVEPGTRGLFTATLRDSSHWADGLPTFDIHSPEMQPYPQRAARQMRRRSIAADSLLSIDELFTLIDVLPDERLLSDSAEQATEPLFAWTRANPKLARRYPATMATARARSAITYARLRRIEPPIAGTYEFSVSVADGPRRTFYARTRAVPTSTLQVLPASPLVEDPTFVARPEGYYLLTAGALSAETLPGDCERERRMETEGYIAVLDKPAVQTPAGQQWAGKIELDLITRVFPADPELRQFAREQFERFGRRRREGLPTEMPAQFTETADGSLRVEQVIAFADGRQLTIRGARISPATVSCRW